jgi:ABC-2 type transport system permease protein
MSALTIARVELTRLFRDRSNLFFVLVLPLLLVVFLGAQFGEGAQQTQVGVVYPADDHVADALVGAVDAVDGFVTVRLDDEDRLLDDVGRARVAAGIVIPEGFGLAFEQGRNAEIAYVGRPETRAVTVRSVVDAIVADRAKVSAAAQVVGETLEQPPAEFVAPASALAEQLAGVEVVTEEAGADELAQEFAGLGQFDLGASSQLFLFVFLTSLTSGSALIQTRQLGIARRMLSTPTGTSTILAGQAGGRLLVALAQAGYIIVVTWLLFRVDWGDPLATASVVLLFGLTAAGAGMLIGSVFDNDSQAAGAGIGLGLVLAALGGSMMPLEFFPDGMRAVARLTPHAWANEAMAEIVRRDGGIGDVLPELGVLAVYALVVLSLSVVLLRRALTR